MTIHEFIEKYYLHDSYFEEVSYDQTGYELKLLINFAFWMQTDYIPSHPESGVLEVIFSGVSNYSCPEGDPCANFVGILDANEDADGNCVISLSDDMSGLCFDMTIAAENVTVIDRT